MIRRLSAVAVLVVSAGLPWMVAGAAGTPAVVAVFSGQVIGVAQDSRSIAWLEASVSGCRLGIHPLAGGADRRVRYAARCLAATHDLALARGRAAWGGYGEVRCSETYSEIYTAEKSRARLVQSIPGDCLGYRTAFRGLVSDGNTFLYSLLVTSPPAAASNCGNGGACHWHLAGGRIMRVAGSRPVTVGGLPPASLIAAADGRFALVRPAARAASNGHGAIDWPRAAFNGKVEIRRTGTRLIVMSFRPRGTVRAVALSATRAAVLVETGRARRIEWYDSNSGARLGATSVPGSTADRLSTDGRLLAFAVDKSVRVLNLETGEQRIVWRATSEPVGLSVRAGRLVWGENTSTKGHILTTTA